MYKTNSNATQGSDILCGECGHFFRCTSILNFYDTGLYMWCQRCHLILNLLKLLSSCHKVSHLRHTNFNLLIHPLIIIIRIEHVFKWDNKQTIKHESPSQDSKSRHFYLLGRDENVVWPVLSRIFVIHSSPSFQARTFGHNLSCHEQNMLMYYCVRPVLCITVITLILFNFVTEESVTWWCSWQTDLKWSRGDWSGVTAEWPHQNQSSRQNMITALALSPPPV